MTCYRKNPALRPAQLTGFSLIEVLVTIVILLIGLLGLAGLQGRALTSQMESYQRAQALILLKDIANRIETNRNIASCYPIGISLGTGTTASNVISAANTTANTCTGHASALSANAPSITSSFCTKGGSCTSQCQNIGSANACPDATAQATAESIATSQTASGVPIVLSDLQAWNNALLGAAETQSSGSNVGAMIGARGCIYQIVAPTFSTAGQFLIVVAWQGLNYTAAPDILTPTSPGQCGKNQYTDERLHRVIALPISVANLL